MITPSRCTLPFELVRSPPREWNVVSFAHEIAPRDQSILLKFRFAQANDDALFFPLPIARQLLEEVEIELRDEWMNDEPIWMTPPIILPEDRDRRRGGINRVARNLIVHCDASQILLAALLDAPRAIYRCLRLPPSVGLSLCAAAANAVGSRQLRHDMCAGNPGP